MSELQPHPSGELADDSEEVSSTEPAGLADEWFAANIREERARLKMSQGELARQMAERGFPYYQQTVRRIEEGRRKVSVGEAKALAKILGTTMDRLTWPGQSASAAALLSTYTGRAYSAQEQIATWTGTLLHAQFQLELTIEETERADCFGSEDVGRLVDEAKMAQALTPEEAIAQGRQDHEALRGTGDDEDDQDADYDGRDEQG
jgi:transcriptional regulator with XRE-family HTH domain